MKILILNLIPNTIGDNLFLTPMFRILKKNYATSRLDVTVSSLNYELFENNKNIDKLIRLSDLKTVSKKGFSKWKKSLSYLKMVFKLIVKIRKEKYDLCIITEPNFFLTHLIPWAGGVKQRIGFVYEGAIFSFLLDKKVNFQKDGYEKHYLDTVLDLLKPLNIRIDNKDRSVHFEVDKKTEKKISNKLTRKKINKYVCLQPGAKWIGKKWPTRNFRTISLKIIQKGYCVVVLGSKKEKQLGEYIKLKNKKIINFCGKVDLKGVAALMKGAKLCICNDSGLAHVSSSVGTPTAVIYGATTPFHSKPLGKGEVIEIYNGIKPPKELLLDDEKGKEVMEKISVEQVYKKIKNYL